MAASAEVQTMLVAGHERLGLAARLVHDQLVGVVDEPRPPQPGHREQRQREVQVVAVHGPGG
jgi:hypothetical protein